MWWLANQILSRLNDDYDPAILDRTLELHEALGALERYHPEVRIVESCTPDDYLAQGYNEYLENEQGIIAHAEQEAAAIAAYEKWAAGFVYKV